MKRLTFVKRCRDFGFLIEQLRNFISLFEDGEHPCVEIRDLAQIHLNQLRARTEDMRKLALTLLAIVSICDATCTGGPAKNCVILDDMAAPRSQFTARQQTRK